MKGSPKINKIVTPGGVKQDRSPLSAGQVASLSKAAFENENSLAYIRERIRDKWKFPTREEAAAIINAYLAEHPEPD